MTTVDDAVEAGARALAELGPNEPWGGSHMYGGGDEYRSTMSDHVRDVLRTAWPILSAGLRGLHRQKINFRPRRLDGGAHLREECQHCGPRVAWPCATVRELDRIDKELGL